MYSAWVFIVGDALHVVAKVDDECAGDGFGVEPLEYLGIIWVVIGVIGTSTEDLEGCLGGGGVLVEEGEELEVCVGAY